MILVAGLTSCGGPQELGGRDSECFRDDECEYGLICAIPAGGETRVCTDDLSSLVPTPAVPATPS